MSRNGFEPSALRAHRLFESHDLELTRERISGVMQPHRLLPRGAPAGRRAHMDFVRIDGIGIGAIAFGEAMRVVVDRLEGYHLLMFCLRGGAQSASGGTALDVGPNRGLLIAPGQHFEADFSADCEQFVLRLDSDAVQAHSGLPGLQWQRRVDLGAPALRPLLETLQALTTTTALLDAARRQALIAADVERLLIHLLLAGQPALALPDPGTGTERRGIAPGCVRRAEEFIEVQLALPLRLGDIAQAAGVPARTLHDAFARFRGMSPMQALQRRRLEHARALLLQPGRDVRIAEVALECGFAHFGRFALAYRQRFHESPSQTLTRRRGEALRQPR
ncbi:AraC family transcriptional regulator [Aquincola sp. S2]|uniref:AraC family transcriptional regulator n=1 Tax=Pseudaquabacterium terrae TaxID=2732868 RepID=A0ABX2EPV5_9BURK|nr:anthranilate 1,2-dioxygenase regulatory protein AndR [Aquabacterium terrae]NRF70618.1 AraC family transcriptional regulator [Aquabacterium terrae]